MLLIVVNNLVAGGEIASRRQCKHRVYERVSYMGGTTLPILLMGWFTASLSPAKTSHSCVISYKY